MAFSGNSAVLDPPGAVDKGLVKNQFLVPTASDITRIDNLLAMLGPTWAPHEITTLAKALVNFEGLTKPMALADLAAVIVAQSSAPFVQAGDIGMIGDGITDDSFALQQDMTARSAVGGAVYFLRCATPGASFYFQHSVRVPSNITLLWASPILLAKLATFYVAGREAVADNVDSLRLAADATAGTATLQIDTSVEGGGPVSNYLAIGDQLVILGNRDGCGTANSQQEVRVTAVSGATLTITPALSGSYPVTWPTGAYQENFAAPDQTTLVKTAIARGALNLLAGNNLVSIQPGDASRLAPGDMVLVKDDTTCADISGVVGGDIAPCGEELALIVPSVVGDPSSTVRLDRRVSRDFSVTRNFRLLKLVPVTNTTISGARFLSAESPDLAPAPRRHWTEQRYAHGVVFDGCVVPNTDIYGRRGDAFRAYRTLEALYLNCTAARAKFVSSGEGNGINLDRSTSGKVIGGLFDAMRHSLQCVSGNGHAFHDVTVVNPRHAPIDCHGTLEVDCSWHDCNVSAGTQYQINEGRAPVAITFGNPTFLAGPVRAGFHGGSINGFKSDGGSLEAAVNLFPGARDCVIDTTFTDIGQLFQFEDLPGLGTVVSSGHRIKASVNGAESRRLVDIQSRANGASQDTLLNTRIEVYGRNLAGCFYVVNATELEIFNCDIDETTFDPSSSYFVEAAGCTGLRIVDNKLANGNKFVRMSGCTNYRVIGNRSLDQSSTTMFFDDGGNTGIWVDNREVGFLGFYTPSSTSSLTVDGRLPGHYDLPDDSVLVLLPIQPKGTGQFYSFSGAAFFARFFYDTVTSFVDLDAVSTFNVDGAVTPLTGTTGVDGRITISVVNATNAIHIENRTGASIRICGRVD